MHAQNNDTTNETYILIMWIFVEYLLCDLIKVLKKYEGPNH